MEEKNELKPIVFSEEIIAFSKIIDKSLGKISSDFSLLNESIDKGVNKLEKKNKVDVNSINKTISQIKNTLSELRNAISVMDKKIKRLANTQEAPRVVNNKEDIRMLKNDVLELKQSIKNIETKLKMS